MGLSQAGEAWAGLRARPPFGEAETFPTGGSRSLLRVLGGSLPVGRSRFTSTVSVFLGDALHGDARGGALASLPPPQPLNGRPRASVLRSPRGPEPPTATSPALREGLEGRRNRQRPLEPGCKPLAVNPGGAGRTCRCGEAAGHTPSAASAAPALLLLRPSELPQHHRRQHAVLPAPVP